jgi:hypothetical protein
MDLRRHSQIIKITGPWKKMQRIALHNMVVGWFVVFNDFFFRFFCFFSAKLVRTITFLSFQIGQLYLVCGCMTIRQCVAYYGMRTHRLMVMHPHTKYHWPISKDKNFMARTRKYYLKNNYLTLRSKVKVPRRSLQYATGQWYLVCGCMTIRRCVRIP